MTILIHCSTRKLIYGSWWQIIYGELSFYDVINSKNGFVINTNFWNVGFFVTPKWTVAKKKCEDLPKYYHQEPFNATSFITRRKKREKLGWRANHHSAQTLILFDNFPPQDNWMILRWLRKNVSQMTHCITLTAKYCNKINFGLHEYVFAFVNIPQKRELQTEDLNAFA